MGWRQGTTWGDDWVIRAGGKKTISLQMCAVYVYKLIETRWIALYLLSL